MAKASLFSLTNTSPKSKSSLQPTSVPFLVKTLKSCHTSINSNDLYWLCWNTLVSKQPSDVGRRHHPDRVYSWIFYTKSQMIPNRNFISIYENVSVGVWRGWYERRFWWMISFISTEDYDSPQSKRGQVYKNGKLDVITTQYVHIQTIIVQCVYHQYEWFI